MRWVLFVGAVLLAATSAGCGGSRSEVPGVPYCGGDVRACPGSRAGTRCAICDDANLTLSCQFPGTGQLALCVGDCAACDDGDPDGPAAPLTNPGLLRSAGVGVCVPLAFRQSSWCALCADYDESLAPQLCDADGFCDPVVCVRSCDTCAPYPG